jgi:hypothetical protein
MISSVCKNIDFLNKYRDKAAKALPEMTDTCFHIANSLLSLLIAAIKFIREDVEYFSTGKLQIIPVKTLQPNLLKRWQRLGTPRTAVQHIQF